MVKSVAEIIEEISPYYKKRSEDKQKELISSVPEAEHKLIYDSSSETLEPVYFFILDLLTDSMGMKVEKLVDNFSSSPGSGHFSELGMKASSMQQQATKVLGDVNTVLRSVLNIIYDLKEFRIRIDNYDTYRNSTDSLKKEAALLSLKQIWLDKVDMQRGQGAIHALTTGSLQFTTLRDAFLAVKDEKMAKEIDLNERVRRILLSRINEFLIWLQESETELKKRYELERTYLKSQVNAMKLYSRWVRPYLKAAAELEQKETARSASLVKTFNTIILELTILAKKEIDVKSEAIAEQLPEGFEKLKTKRKYYNCVLIDFTFRGIPQRVSQQSHYVFGGRAEITFRGYALNEDELKKLDKELESSDVGEALKLIEGTTNESIDQMQKDIDFFLNDKTAEEEKKQSEKSMGANPFLALFGYYEKKDLKKSDEKKQEKELIIRKDDWVEKTHIRRLAAQNAKDQAFLIFNVYKKAHQMPNFD